MGQHSRAKLKPTIFEIYCETFTNSLSSPSSLQCDTFSNTFHLFGQEGYRNLFPRQQLIKLIIFIYNFCWFTPLHQERVKLGIQIAMNNKGSIIPVIPTNPI